MSTSGAHTRLVTTDRWNATNGAYYSSRHDDDPEPIGITSRDYLTGTAGFRTMVDRMRAQRRDGELKRRWEQRKNEPIAVLGPPAVIEPVDQHFSVRHGPAIQIPEARVAPGTFHDMNGVT